MYIFLTAVIQVRKFGANKIHPVTDRIFTIVLSLRMSRTTILEMKVSEIRTETLNSRKCSPSSLREWHESNFAMSR